MVKKVVRWRPSAVAAGWALITTLANAVAASDDISVAAKRTMTFQGRRTGKTFVSTALEGHRTNLASTCRSYDHGPSTVTHTLRAPAQDMFRLFSVYQFCVLSEA